jgi:hypothetical protein
LITFLIVEDCPNKLKAIKDKLIELGVHELRIKDVDNKNDALSLLKEKIFDFLILDINIYNSSKCQQITKNAGVDLLIKLEDSILSPRTKYNIPNTIFVMSEYPEAISNNGESFKRCKVIPCQYDSGSEDWSSELETELKRAELKHQSVIERKSNEIVIYSVHGIQTFGGWQDDLDRILKSHKNNKIVEHIPYKYHHFPITHFLRDGKRESEINKFSKEIKELANRTPEARICLVGHSFGTFLIAESLKSINVRLNIDKIILSGSVLDSSYDWSDIILKHNIQSINNECASNDWALVCSHFFAKGLGMAGIEGLPPHGGILTNRHFNGGHSCFFNELRLKEWSNFIHGGTLEMVNERGDAGINDMFFSLFTKTRKRWVFLIPTIPLCALYLWHLF